MSFELEAFARLRPYLYHLTSQTNIERIRRTWVLESAARIFEAAGRPDLKRSRRRAHVTLGDGEDSIIVRDQAPLHRGNMSLDENWEFEDFDEHLNERVFFWPGDSCGPISYGLRHYE